MRCSASCTCPSPNTTYTGAGDAGATRQIGREAPVRIRTSATAPTPLRIVGSRSHRGDVLDRYLPRLEPYELVAVGSSIKFCLVAEGSADFYPRFGLTSEWDTAAAQAVVEAAGGRVLKTDGQRLRYNTKAEVLNPHFLVSGDPTRDWIGELGLRGLENDLTGVCEREQEWRDHYGRGDDENYAVERANHLAEKLHECCSRVAVTVQTGHTRSPRHPRT